VLPRNPRTTDTLHAAAAEEFLNCLAPRSAACALLWNKPAPDEPLRSFPQVSPDKARPGSKKTPQSSKNPPTNSTADMK
jgi:hypothetical protein